MISQDELNSMLAECIENVKKLGIKLVDINPLVKITKRISEYGSFHYSSHKAYISISKYSLHDKDSVINTLYHEILHGAVDCIDEDGHGQIWNNYAKLVGDAYNQIITQVGGASINSNGEVIPNTMQIEYKYILRCVECGQEFKYMRNCDTVKYYKDYKCGCGGKLEKIK